MSPQIISETPLFAIEKLGVAFRRRRLPAFQAVHDVSFTIHENETVALVGESGSGKSVTALALMGLLPENAADIPAGSRILHEGRDLLALDAVSRRQLRGTSMAMIFQEPMSSLNPVLTIGYQIGEVLRLRKGMQPAEARRRCAELLDEVGLPEPVHMLSRYPSQLSGGQQQRAMIAMALACTPRLLIADEPTTALDVTVQKQIIELLKALKQRHRMSMLFISHDLALVGELADRIVVMRHGVVREQGSAAQILEAPRDRYTQALLQCRPRMDRTLTRLPTIDDFMQEGHQPAGDVARQEEVKAAVSGRLEEVAEAPLLVAEHLGKSFFRREGFFRQHEIKAVHDVSLTLQRGRTLGVVGESGSGKTTLGLTLLRLYKATTGRVLFDGQELLSMKNAQFLPYRRRMQIVFQNPYASLNPRFTVGHSLMEPLLLHRMAVDEKAATAKAFEWLERVGLDREAFGKYPHEFSGGQRQRVALARALTVEPELLILDEPVSALDVSVQAQILNLLKDLQQSLGVAYLFISHDLAVVRYLCDAVMVMHEGRVVESNETEALYRAPQHPYTRKLLAAAPKR